MSNNPLDDAVRLAASNNAKIGGIFAAIGSSRHPRGVVPSAYRNALRAMKSALSEPNKNMAAMEVTGHLKTTLRANLWPLLSKSIELGTSYAASQLELYGFRPQEASTLSTQHSIVALDAISSIVDRQAAAVRASLYIGLDDRAIIGDQDRLGVLRPGDVIAAATYWAASLVWGFFEDMVIRSAGVNTFQKIAVAALDNRTTDCCLRVHGQVKDFNKPFELDGTPHFAREMDWAPFHHYCRTSIALYSAQYDDGITDTLRSSAQTLLIERAS